SGYEFVGDVALVSAGGDATHDAVPLDFLRAIEFVAARNAAGVEVAKPLDVFLNGADQIAFHDLHVVDVVEQLDVGRVDGRDDLDAPGGVVAHVVVVVDFAVEKFEADVDAVVLGDFLELVESHDAILDAFGVGHTVAIAGKGDDVGNARFGGERNIFAE